MRAASGVKAGQSTKTRSRLAASASRFFANLHLASIPSRPPNSLAKCPCSPAGVTRRAFGGDQLALRDDRQPGAGEHRPFQGAESGRVQSRERVVAALSRGLSLAGGRSPYGSFLSSSWDSTRSQSSPVLKISCSGTWLKNSRSRRETTSRASLSLDFIVLPGPWEVIGAAYSAKCGSWHIVPYGFNRWIKV